MQLLHIFAAVNPWRNCPGSPNPNIALFDWVCGGQWKTALNHKDVAFQISLKTNVAHILEPSHYLSSSNFFVIPSCPYPPVAVSILFSCSLICLWMPLITYFCCDFHYLHSSPPYPSSTLQQPILFTFHPFLFIASCHLPSFFCPLIISSFFLISLADSSNAAPFSHRLLIRGKQIRKDTLYPANGGHTCNAHSHSALYPHAQAHS